MPEVTFDEKSYTINGLKLVTCSKSGCDSCFFYFVLLLAIANLCQICLVVSALRIFGCFDEMVVFMSGEECWLYPSFLKGLFIYLILLWKSENLLDFVIFHDCFIACKANLSLYI